MDNPAACTALVLYAADEDNGAAAAPAAAPESSSVVGAENRSTPAAVALGAVGDKVAGSATKMGGGAEEEGQKAAGLASTAVAAVPRFVGLSNQGATCYMNSLLQTLYMTPEFRSALYEWKHGPQSHSGGAADSPGGGTAGEGSASIPTPRVVGEEDKGKVKQEEDEEGEEEAEDPSECIPLQLQKLFGQLQLSDETCVETRALTDSFGWTAQDSFQQHDVQELCRVLFDALESTFQGTVNEKLVNNLYQGSLRDYVTCKECHSESSRLDNFLDISLVLRPFGSDKTMKSVPESLEYFLKPEVLDGDNQYCCQACDKKVDAVKGLKFERLPYLLSLQLKRFDFDYDTFQRIKLNEEMRFPLILDMNKYVDQPGQQADGASGGTEAGGAPGGIVRERSDFQRSVSLEKKKLQGLLGKLKDGGASGEGGNDASDGGGAPPTGNNEGTGGSSLDIGGLVDGSVEGEGEGESGGGVAGVPVAVTGTVGTGDDPDADGTDKDDGSMGSGASMEANGGDVDLPGLEDYWGTSFEEDNPAELPAVSKGGMFGSIGDNRGTAGAEAGSGRGVAWASEEDVAVPEEVAEDPLKLVEANGPWVYELFAVLIHSGSALGGHYYAHIKSLGDDAGWFTFNDSRVTPTDEDDVKRAWGGRWGQTSTWQQRRMAAATAAAAAAKAKAGLGSSSSAGGEAAVGGETTSEQRPPPPAPAPKWGNSAANAYMLMYRRVDPSQNERHPRRDEVPDHVARQVREHARRVAEEEEAAAAAREALACTVTAKVVLNGGPEERTVKGDKRRPLREFVDRMAEAFGIPTVAASSPEAVDGGGEAVSPGTDDREARDERSSKPAAVGHTGAEVVEDGGGAKDNTGSIAQQSVEAGDSAPAALAAAVATPQPPDRLVRLREFLAGPGLAGAPYDEDSSPAELFFSSHKKVWLETRGAGESWARFDRDDVNVAVIRFEPAAATATAAPPAPAVAVKKPIDENDDPLGGVADVVSPAGIGGGNAIPPPPPLPTALFPVLGKFGVERNTRMRASGTVREVRAAFASFAGTKEERTRVFAMKMNDPEGTYRVLCPPPPRRCSPSSCPRQRRRRRRRSAGGEAGGGVTEEEEQPARGDAVAAAAAALEGLSGSPASAPVVGFTTAKALVEGTAGHLGGDSAEPPLADGIEERGTSVSACSGAAADEREAAAVEEGLAGDASFGGSSGSSSSSGSTAVAAADDGVEEEEDRESEVVVLGDRGSNIILRIYVEEVPEGGDVGDGDEEEGVSLAVKVATDQPNKIDVTLDLTGGIEGPGRMSADKRWTSDQLREAIAQAIGRPNRSFRLRKCQANTPEIRPGPETLAKKGFYNLLKLHVSPGRPLELHEEAVTVAPVDVGYRVGLGPAPTSVVLAVAAGRVRARSSSVDSSAGKEEGGGQQDLGYGAASEKVGVGDCRSLKFPEVDAETGPVAICDSTTAPPSADCSPTLGPVGGGRGVGEGDNRSTVVASDLLLTLRGVGAATEGGDSSGGSEAPTASVSSSETGQTTPTNRGIALLASEECKTTPTDQEAVAPFAPPSPPRSSSSAIAAAAPPVGAAAAAASAHPGSAASGTGASPDGGVAWAAAAFAAAAAAQDAKAEAEALTSTYVEVVPPESRWGDQFNVAVHRESTVRDIRRAVWMEMHRRGLGPRRSSAAAGTAAAANVGDNEEGKDDRLPTSGAASTGHPLEEGWTPGALRLRERQVKLPATIVRDADGKVTRLRSRPRDAPWLLVAQVLPREEDLGRSDFPHGGGGGGGGGDSDHGSAETGSGDPGGDAGGAGAARDDRPPQDARVIVVQWWNRWQWKLTEKYEAWVSPTETVASARRRLAEQQAGVDPANLLANRCAPNARLRLFDLRGTASERGSGSGGSPAAEKQPGTWGGSFSSHKKCHWSDLEASRGDQPVGGSAISEGNLVLLQDASQPLKQLAPATEASIAGGGGGGSGAAADSGTTTTSTAEIGRAHV
ncbi:unnamed protein product [Ectocarpus fasciculatus]